MSERTPTNILASSNRAIGNDQEVQRVNGSSESNSDRLKAPLHLTRRGKLVRSAAILATATAVTAGIATHKSEPKPTHSETYIVESGDTAWNIAKKFYPNTDPRDHLDTIMQEVHEDGYEQMQIGEAITIPNLPGPAQSEK